MKVKFIQFITFLFIYSTAINAQSYTKLNLPTNLNTYFFKDSKNILWISHDEWGLSMYNSNTIKSYSFNDSIGIKGNFIQSNFHEDEHSNIWFSTFDHLVKYDRKNNTFSSHQIENDNIEEQNAYGLIGILKNKLWLRINNKIYTVNCENISDNKLIGITQINRIFSFFEKDENLFLVGCAYQNQKAGINIFKVSQDSLELFYPTLIDLPESFTAIELSKHKSDIFVCSYKGPLKYNPKTNELKLLKNAPDTIVVEIKAINEDQLFLSYIDGKKYFYHLKTHSLTEIKTSELPINKIYTYMDLGSSILLNEYYNSTLLINKDQFINNPVTEIANKKINGIHNKNGEIIYLTNEGIFNKNNSKIGPRVDKLLLHENDYIGLYQNELIQNLFKKENRISSNNEFYFTSLAEIHSSSALYATTTSQTYLVKNNALVIDSTFINKVPKNSITKLQIINPEKIVYSINSIGINVYFNNNTSEQLSGIPINSFYKKSKDSIFINSEQGLHLLSFSKDTFKINKLTDLNTFDIIFHPNGILQKTASGIYLLSKSGKLNKKVNNEKINKLSKTYDTGLLSINNEVFIGDKSGLYKIDFERINNEINSPSIQIENIYINNLPYLGKEDLRSINKIKQSYLKNNISFNCSINDYSVPNTASIKYRAKPLINDWQTLDEKELSLNGLTPGTYILEMIGFNSNNIPSEVKTIEITITPPFYLSWWFLLLFSGLLIAAGWYTNYIRTQKQLKAQQIEMDRREAVHHTRENIARDLHDEMGTELNKILFLSDEALYQKDEKEKAALLDKISVLAGDSIKNMRDILWVLNTENETLGKLITRVRQNMFKNLKDHNIKLISRVPPNHDNVILNNDYMKNIHLICKEATNNIIKYADASEVKLDITFEQGKLDIIIQDNGTGIKGEKRSDAYGLDNMEKRAAAMGGNLEINSSDGQGVTIRLKLELPENNKS